jgi:arylsulfatase A-like enzyme
MKRFSLLIIGIGLLGISCGKLSNGNGGLEYTTRPDVKPKNVVFILSDDHRYDFMGFTGKVPWLETPAMDRMAAEGAYFPNAYVTTSLCSPSRASILTGLYSHSHTVVDNNAPAPDDLVFFPQYLQQHGYSTSYFGKWHMGDDNDSPRPGFDHWVSFRGQGVYYGPNLNINGEHVQYSDSTYITDLLTDLAVDWLDEQSDEQPFFMYLSHKAVHANFEPAKRHLGRYEDEDLIYPKSFETPEYGVPELPTSQYTGTPLTQEEYYGENRMPDWVKNQRESWHGVDYMYHGSMNFEQFYKRYTETLLAVDESVGRVMQALEDKGILDETLIIYMGDNGFSFGEHGLIDKRHFYEESAKVPFLVRYPEVLEGGQVITDMVQNIDVGPTILDVAGIEKPEHMHGSSIVPILKGNTPEDWRTQIFYEYYWEYDFPHTPTMHGVRDGRYKLIRYHGIWDTNEFYDLENDPYEMENLIHSEEHQERIREMTEDLYSWLEETDGMQIPLKRTVKYPWGDHRNSNTY